MPDGHGGRDADRCLPVLLGLPEMPGRRPTEIRGLLRLVFLRDRAVPAGSGREGLLLMTFAQRVNVALSKLPAWPLYILGALPPFWFLYLGLTGGLGFEPIKELEHRIGELALQMLIAVLAVTPLRQWTGINLVKFRRALGLLTFYYVTCHLAVWFFLDVKILSEIWADILKRPYITVGMLAFTLMLPLALTSNNWSIRRLGPKSWRRLHQLTYAAGILGAVHFVMLVKGFQIEPLIYLGIVAALLAARMKMPRRAAA
jgi:sulfoxide reductase heme-binding subunit YedZ